MKTKKYRLIAVDGLAASGKGTLARRIAEYYDFAYLDTGLLYRAVGHEVLTINGDISNPKHGLIAAVKLNSKTLTILNCAPRR